MDSPGSKRLVPSRPSGGVGRPGSALMPSRGEAFGSPQPAHGEMEELNRLKLAYQEIGKHYARAFPWTVLALGSHCLACAAPPPPPRGAARPARPCHDA